MAGIVRSPVGFLVNTYHGAYDLAWAHAGVLINTQLCLKQI